MVAAAKDTPRSLGMKQLLQILMVVVDIRIIEETMDCAWKKEMVFYWTIGIYLLLPLTNQTFVIHLLKTSKI